MKSGFGFCVGGQKIQMKAKKYVWEEEASFNDLMLVLPTRIFAKKSLAIFRIPVHFSTFREGRPSLLHGYGCILIHVPDNWDLDAYFGIECSSNDNLHKRGGRRRIPFF